MQTYENFLKLQSGGVHHQKGMLLVLGWIVAIATIDSIDRMNGIVGEGGGFIMCSYGGCVLNESAVALRESRGSTL